MRKFLESNGIRVRTWTRLDNRGTVWEHPDSRCGRWQGDEPTITAVIVGGPNSSNIEGVFWVPLVELRPLMQSGFVVVGPYLGKLEGMRSPPECPAWLLGRVLTAGEYDLCRRLTTGWLDAQRRTTSRREVHRCLNLLRRVELVPGSGEAGEPVETIRDRKTGKERSRWSDSRADMIRALLVDLGAGYEWEAATQAADRTAKRLARRQAR